MVRIVAMVLFGLPVTFAIAMEKTVTSFLPFRLPCFCVLEPSRYRVASMGEIWETIFMGLRRPKPTVRNDTKPQMSITAREREKTTQGAV